MSWSGWEVISGDIERGKGGLLGRGTVESKRWLLRLSPSGCQPTAESETKPIGDDQGKIGQKLVCCVLDVVVGVGGD